MKSVFLGIGAAGLLACPTFADAGPLPRGARYVAMGSSFAAGSGISPMRTGKMARCGQSEANYAALLATRLGLELDDRSCGGATTENVLAPWNGQPAQIDALTPDTRLVTITIGGNDLNYVGDVFAASCHKGDSFKINGMSIGCLPMRWPSDTDYAKLEANLREIAKQAALRAPQARLVFIQYVTLIPDQACSQSRISPEDAPMLRAIAKRLAAITAQVARDAKASLLPTDRLSRHHTPCDAEPWSLGFPTDFDYTQGTPWHPSRAGMVAIADALTAMVSAH